MYTYEIWNKKDDIKGLSAKYWLEGNKEFYEGDVVLLRNTVGIVERVESINTLKQIYGIHHELTTDEAVVKYLEILEEEKIKSKEEIATNKKNAKKISILEKENALLREGLQAVLSGDMQSLAYILYPEDFTDVNNTTLEL